MIALREAALDNLDFIVDAGFSKPLSSITMEIKEELVKVLCLHHILLKAKAELDQLKEGLQSLGVLNIMKNSPSFFLSLFTATEKDTLTAGEHFVVCPDWLNLTASSELFVDKLIKLFGAVKFSEKGSNQRKCEEDTYIMFTKLLYECEGKYNS